MSHVRFDNKIINLDHYKIITCQLDEIHFISAVLEPRNEVIKFTSNELAAQAYQSISTMVNSVHIST